MLGWPKELPFIIRKLPYYPFYDNPNYPQKFAHYPPSHPYYHVIIIEPKQKPFICTTNALNYIYLYKVHWFAGCKLQHICIFSTCASLWRQLSFVVMQHERCFNVILFWCIHVFVKFISKNTEDSFHSSRRRSQGNQMWYQKPPCWHAQGLVSFPER